MPEMPRARMGDTCKPDVPCDHVRLALHELPTRVVGDAAHTERSRVLTGGDVRWMTDRRTPDFDAAEEPVHEPCTRCGRVDTVRPHAFRWNAETYLARRWTQCHDVWVTPQRRTDGR